MLKDVTTQVIGRKIAVVQQLMISFIFTLVLITASFVFVTTEISIKSISILLGVYLFLGSILWFVFLYANIQLIDGEIVMKKMTGTKTRPLSDFKTIESIWGGIFYLEFNDGKKVLFYLTIQQSFDRLNGVDVGKILIDKIFQEKLKQIKNQTQQSKNLPIS